MRVITDRGSKKNGKEKSIGQASATARNGDQNQSGIGDPGATSSSGITNAALVHWVTSRVEARALGRKSFGVTAVIKPSHEIS